MFKFQLQVLVDRYMNASSGRIPLILITSALSFNILVLKQFASYLPFLFGANN